MARNRREMRGTGGREAIEHNVPGTNDVIFDHVKQAILSTAFSAGGASPLEIKRISLGPSGVATATARYLWNEICEQQGGIFARVKMELWRHFSYMVTEGK